ncbi:MAG: hypothetical protein E7479_04190 [Ruminococcaceae bacterium]|nr:hypothetical protein [Oscillospiraceae bacterium]
MLPANLLTNCPFVEYIITQQILQNQVATTEKTNENNSQKLCILHKNEKF